MDIAIVYSLGFILMMGEKALGFWELIANIAMAQKERIGTRGLGLHNSGSG
jgi:hypothetical protein